MYAAQGTQPDITFAVTKLSKFLKNPRPAHWEAVKRVFHYLKGTADWRLVIGEEKELAGWVDVDESQEEEHCAISGFAYLIDGDAVSWSSKQQELMVLSTTEREYVAATHAAKEGLWLCSLISEVFGSLLNGPTTLFSDNQSAIALTKEHQYHARTKHVDIRYHFTCWVIDNGSIHLIYCPTEDMVANTLTKPLSSAKAKHFAVELGLHVT